MLPDDASDPLFRRGDSGPADKEKHESRGNQHGGSVIVAAHDVHADMYPEFWTH